MQPENPQNPQTPQPPQTPQSPQPAIQPTAPQQPFANPTPVQTGEPATNPQPAIPTTQQPLQGQPVNPGEGVESDKEYLPAVLLSYFGGGLGIDRFYLGHTGTAIAKLLTFGGLGIWTLIDILLIAFGKLRDKQGRMLKGFAHYSKTVKLVILVLVVTQLLVVPIIIFSIVFSSTQRIQDRAADAERTTDISILRSALESNFEAEGNYPSMEQINDPSFRSTNMNFVETEAYIAPGQTDSDLKPTASSESYGYRALPSGCDNDTVSCTSYELSALLEEGTVYSKSSLN